MHMNTLRSYVVQDLILKSMPTSRVGQTKIKIQIC